MSALPFEQVADLREETERELAVAGLVGLVRVEELRRIPVEELVSARVGDPDLAQDDARSSGTASRPGWP